MRIKAFRYFELLALQRKLFRKAIFLLLFYTYKIKITPSKRIHKLFSGKPENLSEKQPDKETIRLVKQAIRRANRVLTQRNNCLVQSLTAKKMLQEQAQPVALFLGLKTDKNKNLIAHSWTKSGEIFVTGEKGIKSYQVIQKFES